MSTGTDLQLAQINQQIQLYQNQILPLLDNMAIFRPSEFTAIPQSSPSLNPVTPINVNTLIPLQPFTTINGTNPNTNPYKPLQADALPQYQQSTMDTTAANAFLAQFQQLIPTLFAEVQTQVTNYLNSGGANVAPAIQTAIFNTGYERNLQTLTDAFDLAGARAGAKGNRYTNSMVKAIQAQAMTTYQYGLDDMSRKIVEVMANFANANLKEAISAGVSIDQVQAQIFTQTATVLVRIQELVLDEYKTNVLTNFQIFESQLRLQMTDLEVQKADRDEMRAWIGELRDQIRLTSQVTVTEFEVANKLQVLQAELNKFYDDLVIKQNEQAISLFGEQVKQIVSLLEIDLQQILEDNKLQVSLLESTASVYSKLMDSLSSQGVTISTYNSPT